MKDTPDAPFEPLRIRSGTREDYSRAHASDACRSLIDSRAFGLPYTAKYTGYFGFKQGGKGKLLISAAKGLGCQVSGVSKKFLQ